jgi:hypothetical protein
MLQCYPETHLTRRKKFGMMTKLKSPVTSIILDDQSDPWDLVALSQATSLASNYVLKKLIFSSTYQENR